jgi:hypothetical protein
MSFMPLFLATYLATLNHRWDYPVPELNDPAATRLVWLPAHRGGWC